MTATTQPRPRAVVIGGGIGGLSVAIRLLAEGCDVTVVEQRRHVGGRASQIRDGGFTFDTGPSLITMPWLIDELLRLGGTSLADELTLHRLDPGYRIYWTGEERHFDFFGDRDGLHAETAKFSPFDATRLDAFLEASRAIHEEGILKAGKRPFLHLTDMVRLAPMMVKLDAMRSLSSFVAKYFTEPHLRHVYEFHSLFLGGDPSRVPAIYAALVWLQILDGVWYAEGGMYSLIQAVARTVERGGGTIITGEEVTRVKHRDGRAYGVVTRSGQHLPAEIVVSDADVRARDALVPGAPDGLPWRLRPLRTTMSAYLLYLGVNRRFERLQHHTLIVGDDYHGFIRDVTKTRRLPKDPCVYIHTPSRTQPSMAIPGGDSITVLLPVPNLRSGDDWSTIEPALRERLFDWLETKGGLPGLRESIVVQHRWTPLEFRDGLGAIDGNAFAIEPSLEQSAYFRQPNRDRVVRGLYFVGAGTHPGAGIPGTIMGAEVTANLVREDLRSMRASARGR